MKTIIKVNVDGSVDGKIIEGTREELNIILEQYDTDWTIVEVTEIEE